MLKNKNFCKISTSREITNSFPPEVKGNIKHYSHRQDMNSLQL